MVTFGNQADLIARLRAEMEAEAPRPLAFLTGSGLSVPQVPGVKKTLELIRNGFPADEREELDALLAAHDEPGEQYRQAFTFAGLRRRADFSERILKVATLSAFSERDSDMTTMLRKADEYESRIDSWTLPAGQASLGRILAGLPRRLRGPVLTTNFDPLTEIAVRKAGGTATSHVHTDDSAFVSNLKVQIGTNVVHLHGFWRDSQVLNTSDELMQSRPSLSASLRLILDNHTLVVLGYGGWDDIVTQSLLDAISEHRTSELDVLWCLFRNAEELTTSPDFTKSVGNFSAAPTAIRFYAGIDANEFLPQLEARIAPLLDYSTDSRPPAVGTSLIGWTTITADTLAEAADNASSASALTFYDGRLPSWHDTVNPLIPTRQLSEDISSSIVTSSGTLASSFTIITGPSGEGKTTVAMQVAARIAISGKSSFRVFHLQNDNFGSVEAVLALSKKSNYLLVIDEAHKHVVQLEDLARRVHATGLPGLHILAVSGDIEWASSGGSGFTWNKFVRTESHNLHGISSTEAEALVISWETIGADALGDLARIQGTHARVQALLDFSQDTRISGPGTLLGALLTTRYDRRGLRDHVRNLLERLETRTIPRTRPHTLLDALVIIAIPHAYGIYALNATVLADALDMSLVEVEAHVLIPLGEEAAITYASDHVVIRHELIAAVIIDLVLEMRYDLSAAVARLVRTAATRLARGAYSIRLPQLVYMSTRMQDIPRLAIVAADTALEVQPDRLSYHTSKSAVLRAGGNAPAAAKLNRDALPLAYSTLNENQVRGYFAEWGVVEGLLGNFKANAVLAGISLQDGSALGALDLGKAERGLSCILIALRRASELDQETQLIDALAAATVFSRELSVQGPAFNAALRAAERRVDQLGHQYPQPSAPSKVSSILKAGLHYCQHSLELPFPKGMPQTEFKFARLAQLAMGDPFYETSRYPRRR